MTKSGPATARRVTSDWASAFPEFAPWRPMHLLRRIGPVLQGICLDRSTSGDGYTPTAHVHALTREFPAISLTLSHRLERSSGQPETVLFSRHEDEFHDAVRTLNEQCRLSLSEPPSLDEIVGEYHSACSDRQEKGLPPAVLEMEDSILIAAAAGRGALVRAGIALAEDLATRWPKGRLPLDWVSAEAWLEGLAAKAGDPAALESIVSGQVRKHKLNRL